MTISISIRKKYFIRKLYELNQLLCVLKDNENDLKQTNSYVNY